jgi:hypothetical protein
MSGAQAWHIVLNGMKAANAGWITRIEAEHYSTSISLALKPYWSITTQRATESCAVVVAGLRGVIVPLHVGLARASARPEQAPRGEREVGRRRRQTGGPVMLRHKLPLTKAGADE